MKKPNAETKLAMAAAELSGIVAQLRHAYMQLVSGYVAEKNHKKFADGLIGPQIEKLEKLQRAIDT